MAKSRSILIAGIFPVRITIAAVILSPHLPSCDKFVITLAHIINPVLVPPESNLYHAQPITFASLRAAYKQVENNSSITCQLVTTQFPEDRSFAPPDFNPSPDLTRSILDHARFSSPRKLPLLGDILDRLYQATSAQYLIYSNVDIGVQQHFYQFVTDQILTGLDAFTINRRTIPARYNSPAQLPEIYQEIGEPHRGWDCFVFDRKLFPSFYLGEVCIGAPLVGLALIANLIAFSRNFREFKNEHLTFHIGNDRSWNKPAGGEYAQYNRLAVTQVLAHLAETGIKFPPGSPPANYLRLHRNKVIGFIYDQVLSRIYLPARLGRPLRVVSQLRRPNRNPE